MRARRLAVAASAEHPELRPDWPLLQDALAQLDIAAETAVWTDPTVHWGGYDLVLANGAWDNIHHPDQFLRWTERVDTVTILQNPAQMLRWNLDKRYLGDIAEAGVATVPTTWVTPATATYAWPEGEFVIKPNISGGGFETARYGTGETEAAHRHIERLQGGGRTAMVQPYLSSVDDQGEMSIIFLGGRASHAINKGALLERGAGTGAELWRNERIAPAQPSEAQLDTASNALQVAERLHGPTIYGRVDLVALSDGRPAVLELELLDPALFFETNPAAATDFAQVLSDRIP